MQQKLPHPPFKERQLNHCQFRQDYSNGISLAFALQQSQQVFIAEQLRLPPTTILMYMIENIWHI